MSKPYQAAFENLSQAQVFIASVDCTYSFEEKQNYLQNKIDLLPFHNGDAVGLRVDVCLENTETGETKWIDSTVVHTTCASYRVKELKAVAERKLNTALSDMHMLPKACDRVPSPSLLDREYDKSSKYGRLVMIAAKHHLDGKRSTLPAFVPFVVSDFGELAPAAIDLQEWIVNQYRVRCLRLGRRADGCSTDDLVRNFRHRFKIGVQMAIATGLGAMIQAAGQPWGSIGY